MTLIILYVVIIGLFAVGFLVQSYTEVLRDYEENGGGPTPVRPLKAAIFILIGVLFSSILFPLIMGGYFASQLGIEALEDKLDDPLDSNSTNTQ